MARRKFMDCRFDSIGPGVQDDGTVASGTAGETNLITLGGCPFSYFVMGTQTVITPITTDQTGVDFKLTDTDGQGFALTPGQNATTGQLVYTIGTDPAFYSEITLDSADWSGGEVYFGWHGGSAATLQVHTATFADYTDKATIGNAGTDAIDVNTVTALNNAADVTTDTTKDMADGDVAVFKVSVSAAGVVTYAATYAGTAQSLTTVAYTFDNADTVVPFLWVLNHGDTFSSLVLQRWTTSYA